MKRNTKNTGSKVTAQDVITSRIVEAMATQKRVVWATPWLSIAYQNAITHRKYSGVNVLLLALFGNDSLYLTPKQLGEANGLDTTKQGWNQDLGQYIIKGTKTVPIYFCKRTERRDFKTKEIMRGADNKPLMYFMARYFNVFPLNGVKAEKVKRPALPLANFVPHEMAERLIKSAGITTTYGGNRAFYLPAAHTITLPVREAFHAIPLYYSTVFHEIAHAYLVELGGKHEGGFGGDAYSKEELIAELFANFCLSYCNIDSTEAFDNSVAYLQGWLSKIGSDSKLIISAARQAQNRFDELLKRAGLIDTESEEQAEGEAGEEKPEPQQLAA